MSMIEWREELHPRGGFKNPGQFTHSLRQPEQPQQAPQASAQAVGLHDNVEGLDERQMAALAGYSRNASEINRRLRSGHGGMKGGIEEPLDDLFEDAKLSTDATVYRLVDSKFATAIEKLKPGDALRDDGFMSTSTLPLRGTNMLAMRINASKDSKGIVLGAHAGFENRLGEIVFARGSRLIFRGKDQEGTPEFDLDQGVKAEATLSEGVIDVGGDVWNRETAVKLERDYAAAKPKLEELVKAAVGTGAEESLSSRPAQWDSLSGHDQEKVEQKWKESNYQSELDSAIENWQENDALNDAKIDLSNSFMTKGEEEGDTWLSDAINDHIEGVMDDDAGRHVGGRAELGKPRIPFTTAQIVKSLVFSIGHSTNELDVEFDDKKLQEPESYSKEQLLLPGVEKIDPAEMLTPSMREDLTKVITEAFDAKADDLRDSMDAPEYLHDSAQETVDMYWDEMSDDDKFQWAKDNTNYLDEEKEEEIEITSPDEFDVDPLDENHDSEDYKRTQALAKRLSIDRAEQLMKERGIKYGTRDSLENMDYTLWDSWKGASHSTKGKILQAAIAEELGGRLRTTGQHGVDINAAKENANSGFPGGWEAVKAYTRAKWETTQYLLDKAGKQVVDLYRGLRIGSENYPTTFPPPEWKEVSPAKWAWVSYEGKQVSGAFEDYTQKENAASSISDVSKPGKWVVQTSDYESKAFDTEATAMEYHNAVNKAQSGGAEEDVKGFKKLSGVTLERNGAASMTTDRSVANDWVHGEGDTVLRARVPRTAVVSVPAYGINVHSEHEVVIAGTSWVAWDLWKENAPSFEEVPI